MANTSSAKKAQRAGTRRIVFNARRKKAMRSSVKEMSKLIGKSDLKGMQKLLPQLQQAIDKAAKNGTIKKNAAARMKSRIAKRIKAHSK